MSKLTREFIDPETGKKRTKGNMDMELALDMLKLAPHIDHAVLFSGDGDFCRLLEDVQGMGVRVSVVSTTKTSPQWPPIPYAAWLIYLSRWKPCAIILQDLPARMTRQPSKFFHL